MICLPSSKPITGRFMASKERIFFNSRNRRSAILKILIPRNSSTPKPLGCLFNLWLGGAKTRCGGRDNDEFRRVRYGYTTVGPQTFSIRWDVTSKNYEKVENCIPFH